MAERKTILKRGTIIMAFPDDAEGFAEAREWLARQGYKPDDVRVWREDGQILGQLLRDM